MFDLLRGEFHKAVTTRATIALLAGAATVVALATASTVVSMPPSNLTGPIHDHIAYFIGSIVVAVFALLMGVRSFTDEFRHGTIVPNVLVSPSRTQLLVAKITVAMAVVLVMTILSLGTIMSVALGLARVKGGNLTVASSDWIAFVGFAGAMVVWALLGTGLGAILRNQIAAVVGVLVWILVVENFASGFLGEAARYMPGQLAHGIAQAGGAANFLSPFPALAILVGYALLVCLAAAVMLDRRDVI